MNSNNNTKYFIFYHNETTSYFVIRNHFRIYAPPKMVGPYDIQTHPELMDNAKMITYNNGDLVRNNTDAKELHKR